MLVSDLATILIREQGESQEDTGYVDTVASWIDDAISEIGRITEWKLHRNVFTIPLVAGQQIYDLGPDVKDVKWIRSLSDNQPIVYVDDERIIYGGVDMLMQGTPRYFSYAPPVSSDSFAIQLFPVPSNSINIAIGAYLQPAAVVTNDTIPMHRQMLPIIKDRVRAFMLEHDKDYDGADRKYQAFVRGLNDIMNAEIKKHTNYLTMQVRDIPLRTGDRRLAKLDPAHFRW